MRNQLNTASNLQIVDQIVDRWSKIAFFLSFQILCSAWNWKRPVTGDNHECVGLGFPTEDLRGQNFIRDDSIIIKLTVYLDWLVFLLIAMSITIRKAKAINVES